MLSSSIAKIFIGNFNDVKETQLMVLTIKGQLKGFKAIKVNKNINLIHQQQLLLNQLYQEKFNLLKQIETLSHNKKNDLVDHLKIDYKIIQNKEEEKAINILFQSNEKFTNLYDYYY